jgi:hypothetical protein
VVLVADRGLLSLDNLEQLQSLKVRGGQPLEFVLAVPGRRYAEFDELLEPLRPQREDAAQEVSGEASWKGLRLIWAHDSERAAEQTRLRQARIDEIVASAKARAGKLDGQEDVEVFRGCRLSDSGAKAWMLREVSEANLDAVIKVDLTGDAFTFDTDECALHRARLHDGKLLLVTNVPDLAPAEVVERYKSLADIERGFKVLKSDIEIAPVFHQLPERIKAHALICILALVLHRVLRMQLKDAKSPHSPQRVLEIVKRIQLHQVILPNQERAIGVGDPYPIQREIFETLGLEVPTRQHLKTAVWCQK